MTRPTSHRLRAVPALALIAALGLLPLAGCSSGSAAAAGPTASAVKPAPTGYTVVAEPTLHAGDAVPAPTGKVVLTVSGKIAGSAEVPLDLATIERLGLVEYSVDDKQAEGHRVTFRGVLLSSLLDYLGIHDATTLHTVAINDYGVDIPVSDIRSYPVLLATTRQR